MSSPKSHSGDFQSHHDAFPSGRLDRHKLYAIQHDYYKLLNIEKNATSDEIAASLSTTLDSYKNHPDYRTMDSQLRLAHGVLSNPVLKKYYDDTQELVERGSKNPECHLTDKDSESYEPIDSISQDGDHGSVDGRVGLKEEKVHGGVGCEDAVQKVEKAGDCVHGFSNTTTYDIAKSVLSRKRKLKQTHCRSSGPSAPVHNNINEDIDGEIISKSTTRKARKKVPVKKWGVKQKQPLSAISDLYGDLFDDEAPILEPANVSSDIDTTP